MPQLVLPGVLRKHAIFVKGVILVSFIILVHYLFIISGEWDRTLTVAEIQMNMDNNTNTKTNNYETNPGVLKYIRDHHLWPPSTEPYQFTKKIEELTAPNYLPILAAINNKKNGFFIECGANDGEFISNTIALEYNLQWSGLLIESSPFYFKKLKTRNRKAWISDICLSGNMEKVEFLKSNRQDGAWGIPGIGKIISDKYTKIANYRRSEFDSEGMVECFPLLSVLSAINVNTVDFFSLDVEGHEYQVLKAIPFDKIDIKVMAVEHVNVPEGREVLKALVLSKGYKLYFENDTDFIFQKIE